MNSNSADSVVEGVVAPNLAAYGSVVGRQVTLGIAHQTMRFTANGAGVDLFLHHSHVPFRVEDDKPADCSVNWSIGDVTPSAVPVVRRFENRWELRRLGDAQEEITFYNGVADDPTPRPTMQIVSDPEFAMVHVRQRPRRDGGSLAYVSEYPWAEYIVQRRLGLYGGAILHASMAVFDGVAHVFMGHSGAGKSTITELAEQLGATIPTDDRTILTTGTDGVMAWGTPWHGSFPRTSREGAVVGSISLLVQDACDRLDSMDPGRAVKEMFVRTVQARITEREVQTTLDTLETVSAQVPCFELHFLPTAAAVELVLREDASGARVRRTGPVTPSRGRYT